MTPKSGPQDEVWREGEANEAIGQCAVVVSRAKLMERYVDREVVVERNVGDKIETLGGTLLSSDGGLILQGKEGGVQVV